jgi:hypothetical protein
MMDRTREKEGCCNNEIVEADAIARSLVDFECHQSGAKALRWISHRLARAPQIATAIFDVLAFDAPITSGHVALPFLATAKNFER